MTAGTYRMLSSLDSSSPRFSSSCAKRPHSLHSSPDPTVADETVQPHIATLEYDGRRFNVTCRVAFDGIEYVGRLWFADETWDDAGLPDRGALPGRTRDEALAMARRLTSQDILLRYRRALAEKRATGTPTTPTEIVTPPLAPAMLARPHKYTIDGWASNDSHTGFVRPEIENMESMLAV